MLPHCMLALPAHTPHLPAGSKDLPRPPGHTGTRPWPSAVAGGSVADRPPLQTLIKERFVQVNSALEAVHQTQRAWLVPDTGLRAALKERIYANFLPAYAVSASLSLTVSLVSPAVALVCDPQPSGA